MGREATAWTRTGAPLLAVVTLVCSAQADERADEAKRHYARGVELVRDGLYAEAAAEFEAAYRSKPHFAVLYNLGQSYVAMGRPVEAIDALDRYLRDGGSEVNPDRRAQVHAELARQRGRVGLLAVRVAQAGATVRVDGRDVGRTPLDPLRVAVGAHSVTVELGGFSSRVVEVTLVGEETSTVEVSLVPVPPPVAPAASGLVTVTCAVPDAEVYLDGRAVGKAPLPAPVALSVGAHKVRFQRVGYGTTERQLSIAPNEVASVACELAPERPLAPAHSARLIVHSSEPLAVASLDGAEFSGDGVVPWGVHEVVVTLPGFFGTNRRVVLAPGVTQTVDVVLVPTPTYRSAYEGRAKTRRSVAYVTLGAGLASVAAGAYLWHYNGSRHDRWQAEDRRLAALYGQKPPRPTDLDSRQAANDELIRSIQRTDKVTVALLAGGAVLSGVGVALWATGDRPDRYSQIGLAASPTGAAWAFRGSF